MYADWEYYFEEYLMGIAVTLQEEAFRFWATRASERIDLATVNRLVNTSLDELPPSVKNACCALAEEMYLYETARRKRADEAAAGVLVIPAGVTVKQLEFAKSEEHEVQLQNILMKYLAHSGLLYRGI
jgi:hypothetical protein